jgi:hypothetical protein
MAKSVKERTREYRQRLREEGYKQYLIQLNPKAQEWLERIRDEQHGDTVSAAVHTALHTWSIFEEREEEWAKAKRDEEISSLQARLDATQYQLGRITGTIDTSNKVDQFKAVCNAFLMEARLMKETQWNEVDLGHWHEFVGELNNFDNESLLTSKK